LNVSGICQLKMRCQYVDSFGRCNEPAHPASKGNFCLLHDTILWKERPEEVRKLVYEKLERGDLNFDGCHFPSINLEGITFRKAATFRRTTFHGGTSFTGSTFLRGVSFSKAQFMGPVSFSRVRFIGRATFSKTKFEKKAIFSGARFKEAVFANASFKGESTFSGATFEGDAIFASALFLGKTSFYQTEFLRKTIFSGAKFSESDFSRSKFDGETSFRRASFERADFSYAKLGKASFKLCKFSSLRLFRADMEGCDFLNVRWPKHRLLEEEIEANVQPGRKGIPLLNEAISNYAMLSKCLKEKADLRNSGEFYFREQIARRKLKWQLLKESFRRRKLSNSIKRFWSWLTMYFLEISTGYGERPTRLIAVSGTLIGTFISLIAVLGISQTISMLNRLKLAAYLVITSFSGAGPIGDLEISTAGKWLLAISNYAGYAILTLFMILFTRKTIREW